MPEFIKLAFYCYFYLLSDLFLKIIEKTDGDSAFCQVSVFWLLLFYSPFYRFHTNYL